MERRFYLCMLVNLATLLSLGFQLISFAQVSKLCVRFTSLCRQVTRKRFRMEVSRHESSVSSFDGASLLGSSHSSVSNDDNCKSTFYFSESPC